MVAINCTVLIEECPSPFEDSLTVFALQVRLLERRKNFAMSVTYFCDYFLVPFGDSVQRNTRGVLVMHYGHWLTLLPDLQIVIHKLAPFCLFCASAKEIPSHLITSFLYFYQSPINNERDFCWW